MNHYPTVWHGFPVLDYHGVRIVKLAPLVAGEVRERLKREHGEEGYLDMVRALVARDDEARKAFPHPWREQFQPRPFAYVNGVYITQAHRLDTEGSVR